MKPKISVIIPTFNVQAYIGQALQSVFDQTVANLEIIITDDASTDNTVPIIKSFKDPRIHLTISQRNSGPSYSRNLAIQKAQGEWIALLDGDDWWERNRLERMLEVAEACRADLVADDVHNYKEGVNSPWSNTYLGKKNYPFHDSFISAVEMINYDLGPLKPIVRTDFLLQKGLHYNEEITYGEDFVLLLECLLAGAKMVVFPEPLYIRRAWANSLTAQGLRSTESLIHLTQDLITKIMAQKSSQINQNSEVIQALESRLSEQTDSFLYHQLMEPFKQGNALQGAFKMTELAIRRPRSLAVLAGKVPAILEYRVLRHLRRS